MKRKPSLQVKCDICGKLVFQRGLKSHIRLQHKLKINETTKVITQVKEPITQVNTTQVKETIEITREYTEYKFPIVRCCRCGHDVKTKMAPATLTRLSGCIACESCINTWYSEKSRHYALKAGRYDSNGNSILSRLLK